MFECYIFLYALHDVLLRGIVHQNVNLAERLCDGVDDLLALVVKP